eukprot:14921698-Ditylum_brightwellii.AAC.1
MEVNVSQFVPIEIEEEEHQYFGKNNNIDESSIEIITDFVSNFVDNSDEQRINWVHVFNEVKSQRAGSLLISPR